MTLLPISVFAAGLGKLNVQSGIGEPLKADIELLSVSAEELSSISAAIASEEAYSTQGIERPASHGNIKVEIAKNSSGAPILKLKSNQPISEPFLDMLIQVDWNSGRLLREYTVLLDPPGYTGELDNSAQTSQTTQAPTVKPTKMAKPEPIMSDDMTDKPVKFRKKHKSNAQPAAESEMATPSATSGDEYTTQKGDTLAKIAREMKPEGVSLEQMLIGLYQTNPDAFSGKNINRLNVGKILRPPSEEALNAISRQEASKEIKVQTQNWNAYRNKLAGIVADSAPADAEATPQSASGKIKTAAEDKSAPEANGPKDVVKLSTVDSKNNSAEAKAFASKVAALQEEVLAREKGLKEAQDRTSALEKQIADMQKLLALKNNTMTEMQKQAEVKSEPVANSKSIEVAKPADPSKVEANKPAELPPTNATGPAPVEAAKPVTTNKPTTEVAPVEAPSFLSGLMDSVDLPLIGGAGGLLALLGGGWMWLRNKRKKNLADFEQGIMTSGGLKANTVFGNTSSSSVDTGDTSFLTDFSQSANGGMIDTNDVDPIAEAEVYMAYGRDAQAEEILKDAISKEPKRYELHLKLLEMYAASKNMSAFETVSGELYTTLGADDPTWAKVAEIGIKLEPSNPLYQSNVSASSVAAKVGSGDEKLDASDFSDSPLAAEKDLDFSFDNESLTKDFESDATKVADVDLNVGVPKLDETTKTKSDSLEFTSSFSNTGMLAALGATAAVGVSALEAGKDNAAAAIAESTDLNFDMGSLNADDLTALDALTQNTTPGFSHTMPDLDLAKFDIEDTTDSTQVDSEIEFSPVATSADSTAASSFDLPSLDETTADNDISFESFQNTVAPAEENFGFDIDTGSETVANINDANVMDLSGITLDLDDSPASALSDLTLSSDEPADVETKLDLVAAYIEMDDKEGAKELLDEVMKEGGTNQRKRAETLLSQLA